MNRVDLTCSKLFLILKIPKTHTAIPKTLVKFYHSVTMSHTKKKNKSDSITVTKCVCHFALCPVKATCPACTLISKILLFCYHQTPFSTQLQGFMNQLLSVRYHWYLIQRFTNHMHTEMKFSETHSVTINAPMSCTVIYKSNSIILLP